MPWTSIRDSQSAFISNSYLPAGGKIKDPSKLQAAEVDSLLQFWSSRQEAGQEVFLFRKWQDNDKEMRPPVQEHSTDESGSEAPPSKPTKVAMAAAKGKGKISTQQQVLDLEDALDSHDSQGKSPLYLSSQYQTNIVAVVPPLTAAGNSGKRGKQRQRQQSLPAVQSKPAPKPALPAAKGKGKRSTQRQVLDSEDSDSEDALDSHDNQGESPLFITQCHTNMVAVVAPPTAPDNSSKTGKQRQRQQSLPPAQSKPVPRPLPAKRKRVEDKDHASPAGDRPSKKAKPSFDAVPLAITASRPRSFGPRSSGKRQAKAKAVIDSDVPACRTRSKAIGEQSKGMQTRRTRK